MSTWIPSSAPRSATASTAVDPRKDAQLRRMDIALSLLALLIIGLPLCVAMLAGRVQSQPCIGAGGKPFQRLRLVFGAGLFGRICGRLGMGECLVVFHILKGDMAWVGPSLDQSGVACERLVRPGLVNLWTIRRRTAVDFCTEQDATQEYLSRRSVRHDLTLLMRALFVNLFTKSRKEKAKAADRVTICDVSFDNVSMAEALGRIREMLDGQETQQVSFVNPACVNIAARDRGYRRALSRCAFVLPDGIGTKIAADLLGTPIKQNVNGTDLFPRMCDMLNVRRTRMFLLGGQVGVPERVAEVISKRWPDIEIVGMRDGFFTVAQEGEVARQVRDSGADFLLVARGVPIQDVFIDRHLPNFGVKVAMGVGGLFDFVSGRIDRAPQWMRDIGMEWSYRLLQEPKRMWRRYLIGNFTFLARVMLQKLGLRPTATDTVRQISAGGVGELSADAAAKEALRAVVIATATASYREPFGADFPVALMPYGAQTISEHMIESLANAGVTHIDLVVSDRPEAIRSILGNGRRWGVSLNWHLAKDPARPYDGLRALDLMGCRRVLIGHVDRVIAGVSALNMVNQDKVALYIDGFDQLSWAGWASMSGAKVMAAVEAGALDPRQNDWRMFEGERMMLSRELCMRVHDARSLLDAQKSVLEMMDVPPTWIKRPWGAQSPKSHVDAAAQIEGPVLIGPGCFVGPRSSIGPHVVLTRNVVVSSDTQIENSLVMPDTLIGDGLSVADSVVSGNSLSNLRLDVHTTLAPEDGLATNMSGMTRKAPGLLGRALALVAVSACFPIYFIDAMSRPLLNQPPRWALRQAVQRRNPKTGRLETILLRGTARQLKGIPALFASYGAMLDIVEGRRCWFGVRARTEAEWVALRHEWQVLLSEVPFGLFTEPAWTDEEDMALEAQAAADVYFAARRGIKEHCRVLLHTLSVALMGSIRKPDVALVKPVWRK